MAGNHDSRRTCFLLCLLVSFAAVMYAETIIQYNENGAEYNEDRKPCTYFEDKRCANVEPGLVNCSWYVGNSCCKRTEVTSVFTNMLPLYRASQDCRNRINYMMCFFCSPDQHQWYKNGQAHVCETFCYSIHEACRDAYHRMTRFGDVYSNGTAFCEAQNFKVVNSKYCFKYNPAVFDGSDQTTATILLQLAMLITLLGVVAAQL